MTDRRQMVNYLRPETYMKKGTENVYISKYCAQSFSDKVKL